MRRVNVFPNFKFYMKCLLDVGTIKVDMCINFEETQVLEVLGGKEFCFGMNSMMTSFEKNYYGRGFSPGSINL